MTLYRMFDAAIPPRTVPAGCHAVMGYVGRLHFTPHVWDLAEWDALASIPQIPCWVPDLTQPPAIEADEARHAVTSLGWAPHQPSPRAIVFDFETTNGPAARGWWQICANEVIQAGFEPVMYGSLNTVLQNAASEVIVAAWDGSAQLLPGQTIRGHQFETGIIAGKTTIDLTTIDQWLFDRAGVGPRHA